MSWAAGATAAALLAFASGGGAAQLSIGSGSSLDLGTASLDLGCADLTIDGTLTAGTSGIDAARDVIIDPAGVVNGSSATLEVTGDWDNAGTFDAGASTVRMADGCGLASAVISGDTQFATLDMATTTGKVYRFGAGSTQTVTGSLVLLGAAGNLLTLRSTLDGSEAFLDLQGGQQVDFVDVQDNHAVGDPIALGENSIAGPNTTGWLPVAEVPLLTLGGLAALGLSLLWSGRRALARRSQGSPTAG